MRHIHVLALRGTGANRTMTLTGPLPARDADWLEGEL